MEIKGELLVEIDSFHRGGVWEGLEGDIAPHRNMLAPLLEVEKLFFGGFWWSNQPPSENSWRHP